MRNNYYCKYYNNISIGFCYSKKGLLTFYRQEAPMLLAKKDRGKPTEAQRQIVLAPFGADKAKEFLDGVETLPMENDEEAMDVEGIFQKYLLCYLFIYQNL